MDSTNFNPQSPFPYLAPTDPNAAGIVPAHNTAIVPGHGAPDIYVPSIADPNEYRPENENVAKVGLDDYLSNLQVKPLDDYSSIYTPQEEAKRYHQSGQFNPWQNNEEIAAQNQGIFSKLGNDTAKFAVGAGTAFLETLMSIPDLIHGASSAIANGSASKGVSAIYDNPVAKTLEDFQSNIENTFVNYYTQDELNHPLRAAIPFTSGSANFWFDKIFKGSGLVVGTLAGAVVENAALAATTEGLGNIAALGAEANTISRIFGRSALRISKLATGGSKFEQFLEASKVTGDAFRNAKRLEEAAAGVKVISNVQYGLTLASSSNMMAAQGARESYKSTKDELEKEYIKEHGYAPTDKDDLATIEQYAHASANTKYGLDFVAFTLQNAIVFPNVMKGFSAAKNGIKTGLAATTLEQAGEIGLASTEVKTIQDINNLKLTPQSRLAQFGKWVKPTSIGTQAIVMGAVHGTDVGTKAYYRRKYNNPDYEGAGDLFGSTMEGLSSTFGTTEGLESMLTGALTGLFVGPIEHGISEAMAKKAGRLSPEKASQVALENLRKNSITGLFSDQYTSIANGLSHSEGMKKAVETGDIFEYKNLQAEQFVDMILTGIKSNRFDVVKEQLKMIKELPEEEVNKLMGDINNDTTMAQKHALVDKMMNHADLLKTYHEGISKVFTNNFQYRPDARDEEGKAMTEYYLAYESTKEDLIKSKYAINDRKSRLNDIAESIFKTHERLTPDIVHSVTTYGGLESLKKQYSERSTELFKEQEELGHAKGTADRRTEIRKERATLDTHIGNIERYVKDVNEKKANLAQQAEIFQSLASFEMNGRDPSAERIDVETSDIVGDEGLLQKGFDIDNLKSDINDANALINHLYTEKGFKEWMDTKVFLASEGKRQLQEAKEKGTVANIVQAGEKSYQTGHKYVLQKGMEIPKVTESKDTKGISKFFTKDYWGGINATKIFKSKEEAEVEATKDAETFAKELGTVTITGRELDGRGNIEVKTEDGKTYHIDPALLANHIATETPQEIVDAPERQELNNFVEEYNEKEALTNSKYKTVENVIHEEETGTTETADKIIDDLEIKDIYDAIENREESLDEFTKDARKVVDLMDAKGLSKAEIIDSLNCL